MTFINQPENFPFKLDGTPDYRAYQARFHMDTATLLTRKAPGLLEEYDSEDDFAVEPEPAPKPKEKSSNSFLVPEDE